MATEFGSGIPWPPPGLPYDARIFQLTNNSKKPPAGSGREGATGGYHTARHWSEALIVPVPNFSYGMELDGQFLLVDRDSDSEQALAAIAALPPTWAQRTWSGKTNYVYRVPESFYPTSIKWRLNGAIIGDLKANGYTVMAGSTVNDKPYVLVDGRDPVMAPPEILALFEQAWKAPAAGEEGTRDRILHGERDDVMSEIAGFFRRKRFSEQAMKDFLWAIGQSPAFEQPAEFPWVEENAASVAHSIAKKPPGLNMGPLIQSNWDRAGDLDLIGAAQQWWMRHFVPKRELVLIYGDGGCGKSSWASWLGSVVTKAGGRVLFLGIEEPFTRWAMRAILSGADRDRLFGVPNASKIVFPKYAEEFEEVIQIAQIDLVYLDSIYTHFDGSSKTARDIQTRLVLGCLAEIAQRTGITIVGTFHPNKSGVYSGAAEMLNVPRFLLKAKRKKGQPMKLLVEKTNFGKPESVASFVGREVMWMDPQTGKIKMEQLEDGTHTPFYLTVVGRGEDVPIGKKGKGRSTTIAAGSTINMGDIGDVEEKA